LISENSEEKSVRSSNCWLVKSLWFFLFKERTAFSFPSFWGMFPPSLERPSKEQPTGQVFALMGGRRACPAVCSPGVLDEAEKSHDGSQSINGRGFESGVGESNTTTLDDSAVFGASGWNHVISAPLIPKFPFRNALGFKASL
jgi:hypothetical protein